MGNVSVPMDLDRPMLPDECIARMERSLFAILESQDATERLEIASNVLMNLFSRAILWNSIEQRDAIFQQFVDRLRVDIRDCDKAGPGETTH